MKTILDNITRADVCLDPFPHVEIANALPPEIIAKMLQELPTARQIDEWKQEDTSRSRATGLHGDELLKFNTKAMPTIQEYYRAHTSPEFKAKVMDLFGEHARKRMPYLPTDLSKIKSVGSLVVNPPQPEAGFSPRSIHLDSKRDVFVMLLYLRPLEDTAAGGDLNLYRYKRGFRGFDRTQTLDSGFISETDVEIAKTVPYQLNRAVLMLDGIDSVHGTTLRAPSPHCRYYLSAGANCAQAVYEPSEHLPMFLKARDTIGHIYQAAAMRLRPSP